ncbi:hypothetical protein F4859DRAFT_513624 [Xylaria cf. heliscus]|nr:hypothetical protein F4859DRAFT_513624 [Xylaria cf. heliscus]
MKITISTVAITAATMLASISASPLASSITTTITVPTIPNFPPPAPPSTTTIATKEIIVVEDADAEAEAEADSTLTAQNHKKKPKEVCKRVECKMCVHQCGEASGLGCIYYQCMPTVCKHCNLMLVTHPTRRRRSVPEPAPPRKTGRALAG